MPASSSAFAQIGQIASQRAVHAALGWLHLHEQQIMRWQSEAAAVAAPPFQEQARAQWFQARFQALGLRESRIDPAGNAVGWLGPPDPVDASSAPIILLSAHLDTVFPAETPIDPVLTGTRLHGPGVCDNGAGLAALLGIGAALLHAGIQPPCRIVLLANVGEEGEGDLRGMRHIYQHAPWRHRIAAHLVLDGAGHSAAVHAALGSRRFEVTLTGAGGHSWSDAGRPNPILALCDAIHCLGQRQSTLSKHSGAAGGQPGAAGARSTWNVGTIEGGSTVNTIPAAATARFDLRSTDASELLRIEVELYRAVEDAVLAANRHALPGHQLRSAIRVIGDRPTGMLPEDARILALLRAVDRHLGLRTELHTASTDANIPLSLGVEAISIGAGGEGGGVHTTAEWFDAKGRDLGLRRILLLLLALADCHAPAVSAE
jgi:tripeptide aminopeptidase